MSPNDETPIQATTIGPGAVRRENIQAPSLLEGVKESDYVELINPLSVTFIGRAALTTDVAARVAIGKSSEGDSRDSARLESDIQQLYGLDLRANAAGTGKTHIITDIPLESGKSLRLLGREAKVVVRQLVTTMMQLEGKRRLLANPVARRQAEERIVLKVGSLNQLLGNTPLSIEQQLQASLNKVDDHPGRNIAGEDANGEVPFAGLRQQTAGAGTDTGESDAGESAFEPSGKRSPGRSRASQQT